jgi:hypothetical protein
MAKSRCSRCAALGLAACLCAYVWASWPRVKDTLDFHLPAMDMPQMATTTATVSGTNVTSISFILPDRAMHDAVADRYFQARPVPRPLFEVRSMPPTETALGTSLRATPSLSSSGAAALVISVS